MANVSVHVRKSQYLTMAGAKSAFMSLIFSRLECRFPAIAVHERKRVQQARCGVGKLSAEFPFGIGPIFLRGSRIFRFKA
jgi:hypothetical protein